MARPERNTVDYFPLYCKDGKGMYYIEQKYGNDGYATWLKILCQLATTDYHYIDLSNEIQFMFLSAKCKIDKKILESIINDLVVLGEFDKELWNENKVIFSEKFISSIKDAYDKRNNNCIDRNSLLLLLISLGIRKPSKSIPKPLKEQSEVPVKPHTILDYTILDKSILLDMWKNDYECYKYLLNCAYSETIKDKEWIELRKEFHPNLDIIKTLYKSCFDYWSKPAGWKNKIKARTKEIDWKSTFNNALSQKCNQVWIQKD